MQHNQTLYTVKDHEGAHLLLDAREINGETVAEMQLIGALLPFDVKGADLEPFQMSNAMKTGDPIGLLAQEAVTIYGADPKRVQKAADLARQKAAVQQAHRDENGEQIKPSLRVLAVKGSSGWYVVKNGTCTCKDNEQGNICKHRIAAWMHREAIARPLAAARRTTPAKILAELEA